MIFSIRRFPQIENEMIRKNLRNLWIKNEMAMATSHPISKKSDLIHFSIYQVFLVF